MNFNIENDRSTDAHVGWYVKNLTYNAGEISGLLVSTMVFACLFSKLMLKSRFKCFVKVDMKTYRFLWSLLTRDVQAVNLQTASASTAIASASKKFTEILLVKYD